MKVMRIGIAGFGAVGSAVAKLLSQELHRDIVISGVTAANIHAASTRAAAMDMRIPVVSLADLIEVSDVIVEAATPGAFRAITVPTLLAGRDLIICSTTGLLECNDLVDMARAHGARIFVPSCSLPGIDGVVAAAQGRIHSVKIITRKPPSSLLGADAAAGSRTQAKCLFSGTVRQAAMRFPANVNVAATLALAGIGPDATLAEVWVDPTIDRNMHRIEIDADATRFVVETANLPDPDNPRTGKLTALGIVACVRKLRATLVLGI